MEAKKLRVATMAVLCVLLLLVEPQQVAAMSEYCQCYRDCYSECRQDAPRWLCLPSCVNYCSSSPGTSQAAAGDDGDGGAMCRMACKWSVCGWPAAPGDAADTAMCMKNCNRKWSHKAN